MVNSYPACRKSDNSALFVSCSSCYYTARWTVPTFLLTSLMDVTIPRPTPHSYQNNVSLYKVSYLLTKHKICRLFCSKMCIYCCYGNWSITKVTGVRGFVS